ncbi:MAG: TetR/AcrR family transcriptional regulator [Pseudomonadota bacterium]
MSQIATEADLTTGAIYRRFKDKRALLQGAFERFAEDSIENQSERVEKTKGQTDAERVELMIRATLKFTIPYLPLMRAASALNDQTSFEHMRKARNITAEWWAAQLTSSHLSKDELTRRMRFAMRMITAVFRDTLLAGPGAEGKKTGYKGKAIENMVLDLIDITRSYLQIEEP